MGRVPLRPTGLLTSTKKLGARELLLIKNCFFYNNTANGFKVNDQGFWPHPVQENEMRSHPCSYCTREHDEPTCPGCGAPKSSRKPFEIPKQEPDYF